MLIVRRYASKVTGFIRVSKYRGFPRVLSEIPCTAMPKTLRLENRRFYTHFQAFLALPGMLPEVVSTVLPATLCLESH